MRLNKIDNVVLDVIKARVCEDLVGINVRAGRLAVREITDEELDKSIEKLLKQKLITKMIASYNGDQLEIYFPMGTGFSFNME